jgi:hypothetical protein
MAEPGKPTTAGIRRLLPIGITTPLQLEISSRFGAG